MNMLANPRARDLLGGILVMLIGAGTLMEASRYPAGSLSRMGPGFFPMSLGVIMVFMGGVIAVAAKLSAPRPFDEALPPEWRGWACICLSVVAFGVLGKFFGLLPATFAIVFISALGDKQNSVGKALMLSALMMVFCVIVFAWGLKIQLPLFHLGA